MSRAARPTRRRAALGQCPERLEDRRVPTTFTVGTTADTGPGSLRQAILDANASPGADLVSFAIPGDGVQTIRPASALPTITDPLAIDGYTQPGSMVNDPMANLDSRLLIELDGSLAGTASGLVVTASDSSIRGLVINRFAGDGIRAGSVFTGTFEGPTPSRISITGNRIGTDPSGLFDRGNGGDGVFITRTIGVTIGGAGVGLGNVISGNDGAGIGAGTDDVPILGSVPRPSGFVIQGNTIGTDPAALGKLGNGGDGVLLRGVNDVTIGGTAAGAGNYISGNGGSGLRTELSRSSGPRGPVGLNGPLTGYVIQGNVIGLGQGLARDLGNGGDGIALIGTDSAVIGGPSQASNAISANKGDGIRLSGETVFNGVPFNLDRTVGTTSTLIQGNKIGAGAIGAFPLGNKLNGIEIQRAVGTHYGPPGANASATNQFLDNGGAEVLSRPLGTNYEGGIRANRAVYLPAAGAFAFASTSVGVPDRVVPFGLPGPGQTVPDLGDFDGDGVADLAAYLPALGAYAYRPSGGGPDVLQGFGLPGAGQSIPSAGDFDGDGRSDVAVYLPALGAFGIRPSGGGPDVIVPFGPAGPGQTIPAPADYFGTGRADIAAYLPSLGAFAIQNPAGGDPIIPFGLPGPGQSIPSPGDYDGDGKVDLAVYLPALGVFAYRPSGGGPDVLQAFGPAGPGQSIPVPGDYSGSGRTEVAVYLPAYGAFAIRSAGEVQDMITAFGSAGPGASIPPAALPGGLAPPPAGVATARAVGAPEAPAKKAAVPIGPALVFRKLARPAMAAADGPGASVKGT